jgi:hypothetical protein
MNISLKLVRKCEQYKENYSYLDCIFPILEFKRLAPEFYIQILAHPLRKMCIIQESKKVALLKKRRFEEKNGDFAACSIYSVLTFIEKIFKMQLLYGSGMPVLYIGRTVLKES